MSAVKSKLKAVKKLEPQTIAEAVASVIAAKTELSQADHEYAIKVYSEEEAAKTALNQAVAALNMATGARQSFAGYIIKAYQITGADSIDVDTGAITRAPHTE